MSETAFLLGTFTLLLVIGVPIAYAMGISTLGTLAWLGLPSTAFFSRTVSGLDSTHLIAIPLFVLAGEILSNGGIARRLINIAVAALGWIRGGLGLVNVGSGILFAGVSGSSTADVAAIGGVMIPGMKKQGYRAEFAAAVTASASLIGPIIPPSVLLILYAGATGVSAGTLFVAGIVPGLVTGFALLAITWWVGRRQVGRVAEFDVGALGRSLRRGALSLLIPAVVVYAIATGAITATEGSVVVVALALVLSMVVHRELKFSELGPILVRSSVLSGVIMLLVAMSVGQAWVLAFARTPEALLDLMFSVSDEPWAIMFMAIVFLIVIGVFIEPLPAIIITVPILFPIGETMGFDPIHFAIVIIITLLTGTLTPPVGIILFLCAGMAKVSIGAATRAMVPFFVVFFILVLALAYLPIITTWLPSLIG